MCGVAGFTHHSSIPAPGRIRSAVQSLAHRGPDQHGIFESPAVSLGAARLKIIDLESGDQPIVSNNGDSVIVFNGEIYNHAELRSELESRGHRFRSRSDTETVLAAFLEWDVDCFSRFRGMFAAALWTESRKRLVLARDRLGIKPLYIARRGRDLYFGSELKSIFVHPEIERRLSLAGLDCYLALNYVPAPWTLVDGVEKLPPGHWLEWRDGQVCSSAYWRLPDPAPVERSLEAAREELHHLLQQSVREHLLSDVPLGVWLSGGLDSSTLLHYIAQSRGSNLKTFSVTFPGRSFDEASYARRVAQQYGAEHNELPLDASLDLPAAIEEFAWYADEPDGDAGALPVWFLSRLTRQTVTVALSGEGADELFGGYLTHRANELARRMRTWLPPSALRLALGAAVRWPVSDEKIGLEYKAKRFLAGCLMSPERAHVYWNGTFTDLERRELLCRPSQKALEQVLAELRRAGDHLGAYLRWDQKYYLADDILAKVDRMSMAHSVEVRPPFLDHRIAEFAATLPYDFKIRGSRQKVILKELMKDRLPHSVIRRKKEGFDIPVHQWLRGPLRPLLMDTLSAGASDWSEVLRIPALNASVQRHMDMRENLGYHLWGVMLLFLWAKKWGIQTAALETGRRAEAISASI